MAPMPLVDKAALAMDAEDTISVGTFSEIGSPSNHKRVSICDPTMLPNAATPAAVAAAADEQDGEDGVGMRRSATNKSLKEGEGQAAEEEAAAVEARPVLSSSRSLPLLRRTAEEGAEGEVAASAGDDGAAHAPDDPDDPRVLVYIDRIPADASASMIYDAIAANISAIEDDSLDIIRKHKTRHCHGFAVLSSPWPNETQSQLVKLPPPSEEEIRLSLSDLSHRQRAPAELPVPRKTLRLRIYAQRKLWLEPASRLTWAGVLAVIKDIAPGQWESVLMLADDMKKKKPGTWAHPSVLLGAYFVDCGSAEAAQAMKDALHDKRACIQGVYFLVEAQFTCDVKHLHEKGKQNATERRFQLAKGMAASGEDPAENFAKKRGRGDADAQAEAADADAALRKHDSVRSESTAGIARAGSNLAWHAGHPHSAGQCSPPDSTHHSPLLPPRIPATGYAGPQQQQPQQFTPQQQPQQPAIIAGTQAQQQGLQGTPYQQPVSPAAQVPAHYPQQYTPVHSASAGGLAAGAPPPFGLGQPQQSAAMFAVPQSQQQLDELLQSNAAFNDMYYRYFSEEGRQRFRDQWFSGGCHGFTDMVSKLHTGGILANQPGVQQPQQAAVMPAGASAPQPSPLSVQAAMPPASPMPPAPQSPAPGSIPALMMSPGAVEFAPSNAALYPAHMQLSGQLYTFTQH